MTVTRTALSAAACVVATTLIGCGGMSQQTAETRSATCPQGSKPMPAASYAFHHADDGTLLFVEDARAVPGGRCGIEIVSGSMGGCTPPQRQYTSPAGVSYCVPRRP